MATVVAYYGEKPAQLLNLAVQVQQQVQITLGPAFVPYVPEQVHATIVGLESLGVQRESWDSRNKGELNGVRELLRQTTLLPMEIQIGGFCPEVDYGFSSRGLHPVDRSFSLQGGAVVGMSWPVSDSRFPNWLDALRRRFQDLGLVHKYHLKAGNVDNDLYFVLGRYSGRVGESCRKTLEREMRRFFSANPCRIPLRVEDVSIALYGDETLPLATTTVLPIVCDSIPVADAFDADNRDALVKVF